MKKVLIITHSSENGLNYSQMMEVMNILGSEYVTRLIRNPEDIELPDVYIADKIIMIVPEWNGSFPYSFKKMIDDSGWPSFFSEKEILLIGTSNTSFGNIMGITHLQHILGWMGSKVYHKRVSVPHIDRKFSNNNIVVDERLVEIVREFCS
jgi:NAD(P)H-dependent FMN reductase